jgi:hypothetical protein
MSLRRLKQPERTESYTASSSIFNEVSIAPPRQQRAPCLTYAETSCILVGRPEGQYCATCKATRVQFTQMHFA